MIPSLRLLRVTGSQTRLLFVPRAIMNSTGAATLAGNDTRHCWLLHRPQKRGVPLCFVTSTNTKLTMGWVYLESTTTPRSLRVNASCHALRRRSKAPDAHPQTRMQIAQSRYQHAAHHRLMASRCQTWQSSLAATRRSSLAARQRPRPFWDQTAARILPLENWSPNPPGDLCFLDPSQEVPHRSMILGVTGSE